MCATSGWYICGCARSRGAKGNSCVPFGSRNAFATMCCPEACFHSSFRGSKSAGRGGTAYCTPSYISCMPQQDRMLTKFDGSSEQRVVAVEQQRSPSCKGGNFHAWFGPYLSAVLRRDAEVRVIVVGQRQWPPSAVLEDVPHPCRSNSRTVAPDACMLRCLNRFWLARQHGATEPSVLVSCCGIPSLPKVGAAKPAAESGLQSWHGITHWLPCRPATAGTRRHHRPLSSATAE